MSELKIKDGDITDKYLNVIGTGATGDPYQSVVPDYRIPYAINQIFQSDAVTVSVMEKGKSLVKFGENSDVDAGVEETVWETGGIEALPASDTINRIVSDNAGDTQSVVVEGHTLSGSDFTFVSQTVTLTGTTAVTLATPLARVSRLYNNDSTDFAGTVTVYINAGTTHLTSEGNGSFKCSTTLSSADYWIITSFTYSVNRANTAKVDFKVQVAESGKVFRTIYGSEGSDSSGTHQVNFDQPFIMKPNSDVRVTAISNAANTKVQASLHGYLAIIV